MKPIKHNSLLPRRAIFSIPTMPMGKARAMQVGKGRAVHSDRYKSWIERVRYYVRQQWRGADLIEGPLCIEARFSTPTGTMPSDIDNALGAVMDALQGIIFKNDKSFRECHAILVQGPACMNIDVSNHVSTDFNLPTGGEYIPCTGKRGNAA